MAKRMAEDVADGTQAYMKRQKISNVVPQLGPSTEIYSSKQLHQLLAFDQDTVRAKHAIQSFKTFLETCINPENENHARQTSILKEFLESYKPAEEEKTAVFSPELMQTWSFASQSNDESLLSAVSAVLALLLKTLSNQLDLSNYGMRLCRTLLQRSQLDLMVKGLTANKGKDFVISPVLRLLRELSTFDGGSLANQIFRSRDQTLKGLARNLGLRYTGDGFEDIKKPSVRTNALRFILSLIKFLPVDAKRELLNQRDIVLSLTRDIKDDPPFMVQDILETLKSHVLQDEALPRDAKTRIVNATTLARIALLYNYDQSDDGPTPSSKSVSSTAHDFLTMACTTHDLGVLNRQTGFYPRGIDPDDAHDLDTGDDFLDLGLDSIEWMDRFTEEVPVRNTILSDFIQNLRPWSNNRQRELLIAIFAAAPELVAGYFFSKKTFSFDPKLTATWIGYSSLLFSSIQLPIPKHFGHPGGYARLPPPPSIVLENILPQPLTQRVLRTCLLQSQDLIRFFAIRILRLAFIKLQKVLNMYQEAASGSSSLWSQAATVLKDQFCRRCPSIKDVIHAFRNLTSDDLLQREATTKLLVLYFEVIPSIALEAKFDVSGALTQTLQILEGGLLKPEERILRAMELENLFQFAHFSPGMRWFAKTEELPMSPFMSMLKFSADTSASAPLLRLNSVLESIVKEYQILQTETAISILDSLILRLRALESTPNSTTVYTFLDNCISRCAAKPVKYIFGLEEIQNMEEESRPKKAPFSLLTLVIVEQWPFMVKSLDSERLSDVAQFVAQYIAMCIKIKEDKKALKVVLQRILGSTPESSAAHGILQRSRKLVDIVEVSELKVKDMDAITQESKTNTPSASEKADIIQTMLEDATPRVEDHKSLVKWTTKEVDEVVEGGHAAALISLLSSEHLSVRKEALTNISKFASKLKESTFEEKEQIWLLLCEIVETAREIVDEKPLATIITTFASHSISVLVNPLHCLYPKINKFLSQGPSWEVDKIPLMYKILDESPSLDDAYYTEINWLLTYMLAGLRTTADMAIFRKKRVFEKLFSLWNSTYLGPGIRDKILRILFRASTIEGGSTTLITRFSTMTWLQAQIALGAGTPLKVLMERIIDSSDRQRVERWSEGVKAIKSDTLDF
ncbi:ribosome 60S biogenesis N-terminal-domain-containing protein [Tricladium varicosporioides]|nr:ribosome 60S biogenesis N-terminal-domain-containing protein [Hymenoscyphus varicosporioides]